MGLPNYFDAGVSLYRFWADSEISRFMIHPLLSNKWLVDTLGKIRVRRQSLKQIKQLTGIPWGRLGWL
jgi:hypothetical protein